MVSSGLESVKIVRDLFLLNNQAVREVANAEKKSKDKAFQGAFWVTGKRWDKGV
jgi:hypothetical protein